MRREREVEVRLEAAAAATLPSFEGLPGVARVDAPLVQELEAIYFDTADAALARAGAVLRRRTGGDDAGWHVKIALGPREREELQLPLGDAETPPAALRSAIARFIGTTPVAPVARICTHRTVHVLRGEDGTPLAEVADDRVTAAATGRDDAQSWREWEAELRGGGDELFDAIVERLIAAGGRWPEAASKLTRLLPPARGAAD